MLHELAAELQLRNVEFVGMVTRERMAELYNEADCFLNGSRVDNQPLSILESFASGLPVVTTNAGGIPDVVTDNVTALMVKMDDHEDLARRAIALVEQPELAHRIINAAR